MQPVAIHGHPPVAGGAMAAGGVPPDWGFGDDDDVVVIPGAVIAGGPPPLPPPGLNRPGGAHRLVRDNPVEHVYDEIDPRLLRPPLADDGEIDDLAPRPQVREAWGARPAAEAASPPPRPASWGGEALPARPSIATLMGAAVAAGPAPLSPVQETSLDSQQRGVCVICVDAMANCVIKPCKHLCLCDECLELHVANATRQGHAAKCPLCNGPVEDTDKLFIS
jgi:hypothetical protein